MTNEEYNLNFSIPEGPTGPQGLSGNYQDPQIFLEYNSTENEGKLSIKTSKCIPEDSNTFFIDNGVLKFSEYGYFEFTLSGVIKASLGASIILRTSIPNATNDLITINLDAQKNQMYFFYVKTGRYQTLQTVNIHFIKRQNSTANVENIKLSVRKLPFQI